MENIWKYKDYNKFFWFKQVVSYQLAITETNFGITDNLDTPGTDLCMSSTFPNCPIENS